MKHPDGVVYGVHDTPPATVTFLSGLQHVGLTSIYLLYPVLVAEAAGADARTAAAMVSLTLVALAIGTVLQVIPRGPVGSGYLCYPVPTVVYLVPSLLAAKAGGLPLVFGMLLAAGLLEIALSRLLKSTRPYFPPEVSGLVVLLIGIATGVIGLRTILGGVGAAPTVGAHDLLAAALSIVIMIGLYVWGTGLWRMLCVLVGMLAGYALVVAAGFPSAPDLAGIGAAPTLALPGLGHVGWSLDWSMAVPFGVAAIAATLKTVGNVTTLQRATDADWKRTDMRSVTGGVLADGLGNIVAGGIGAHGLNSSTPAAGLASATGVHSRRIAWAIAGLLLVLALTPKLGLMLYHMPRPVAGAALLFSGVFIVVNGLQMMTARMLDARRSLVIGLGLMAGLSVDMFPGLMKSLPAPAQSVIGTSLVLGTLVALLLNLLFRMGVKRHRALTVPLAPIDTAAIEAFMRSEGSAWGARREVIERAAFNLAQCAETLIVNGIAQGPLELSVSYDEFNVDVRVSYTGPLIELPLERPAADEILASPDGERRLAGYLLRRLADRVAATHRDGRTSLLFHFEH